PPCAPLTTQICPLATPAIQRSLAPLAIAEISSTPVDPNNNWENWVTRFTRVSRPYRPLPGSEAGPSPTTGLRLPATNTPSANRVTAASSEIIPGEVPAAGLGPACPRQVSKVLTQALSTSRPTT